MKKDDYPPAYYQGAVSPPDAQNPYSIGELKKRMWWFAGKHDNEMYSQGGA